MFGKDKGVKNIRPEILTKTVEVSGKTVNVHITALSGEVEGKREILDEVLIDDFTSQLGGLLKRTTSRYFP